jgi:hypothetical protein
MLSDQQWKRIDEPPDRSRINGLQGERWFCTEQEAIAAGWRKAKV